jgi:hypothetical protein
LIRVIIFFGQERKENKGGGNPKLEVSAQFHLNNLIIREKMACGDFTARNAFVGILCHFVEDFL